MITKKEKKLDPARVIVERITSRVKVPTRTEILHCSNSLQFPYRRFRCVSWGDSELASWKRENIVKR